MECLGRRITGLVPSPMCGGHWMGMRHGTLRRAFLQTTPSATCLRGRLEQDPPLVCDFYILFRILIGQRLCTDNHYHELRICTTVHLVCLFAHGVPATSSKHSTIIAKDRPTALSASPRSSHNMASEVASKVKALYSVMQSCEVRVSIEMQSRLSQRTFFLWLSW